MQFPLSPAYCVVELVPHLSHDAALETQRGDAFSGDGLWPPSAPFEVAPLAPPSTPKTALQSSGQAPADAAPAAQLAGASPGPRVADTVAPIP